MLKVRVSLTLELSVLLLAAGRIQKIAGLGEKKKKKRQLKKKERKKKKKRHVFQIINKFRKILVPERFCR